MRPTWMPGQRTPLARVHTMFYPLGHIVGFIDFTQKVKQERVSNIFARATKAQLGECQTQDLKVPASIPGLGIFVLLHAATATSKNNIDWTERAGVSTQKIPGRRKEYIHDIGCLV